MRRIVQVRGRGRISFDENGDVYGYQPFAWYVWTGGNYQPVNPTRQAE